MGLLLLVARGWGGETGVSGTLKRSDSCTGGGGAEEDREDLGSYQKSLKVA